MDSKQRRAEILEAAMVLSEKEGYVNLTATKVAKQAKCSRPLVVHYFGDMGLMRDAVMKEAIEVGCRRIILQGLYNLDPLAIACDSKTKQFAHLGAR